MTHSLADSRAGKMLNRVVTGYFNYHAVPTNSQALAAFRFFVIELRQHTLRCRSQKAGMTWSESIGFSTPHEQ
jgi:RNA-directed DNA polymerase